MADPFVGEIKMFGGNFAPLNYAFCNGGVLPIDQNDALFALIGTTYGGDGQTTFGIPDLRGRLPVHQGSLLGTPFTLAQSAGTETVTLTSNQLPIHTHGVLCNNAPGTSDNPSGNFVAAASKNFFSTNPPDNQMGSNSVQPFVGGNLPHANVMPYLCVSFIIALYGVYPTQQ